MRLDQDRCSAFFLSLLKKIAHYLGCTKQRRIQSVASCRRSNAQARTSLAPTTKTPSKTPPHPEERPNMDMSKRAKNTLRVVKNSPGTDLRGVAYLHLPSFTHFGQARVEKLNSHPYLIDSTPPSTSSRAIYTCISYTEKYQSSFLFEGGQFFQTLGETHETQQI